MCDLRFAIGLGLLAMVVSGCGTSLDPTATWHSKCGWKAEDYFTDPKVIALCHAIEADDLAEIDRLVAAGADVNAQGKGKMTPLLWAFPDNKLPRFKRLLEHKADPNVIIESDFNTRGAMGSGDAVTHLVCKTAFPGYFEAVFEHGGDPSLRNSGPGKMNDVPISLVIQWGNRDREGKVKQLIDLGADLDVIAGDVTPTMLAVRWGGQYSIAAMLLEAGADYRSYDLQGLWRLVHVVVGKEDILSQYTPQQRAEHEEILRWLEKHGESAEIARADVKRWRSWLGSPRGEFGRRRAAEIAERDAKEKAAAPKGLE